MRSSTGQVARRPPRLGWTDNGAARLETGPLTAVRDTTLSSGARGWITHASGSPRSASQLQAVVRRPGGVFSAPVTLGRLEAYPLAIALAPASGPGGR